MSHSASSRNGHMYSAQVPSSKDWIYSPRYRGFIRPWVGIEDCSVSNEPHGTITRQVYPGYVRVDPVSRIQESVIFHGFEVIFHGFEVIFHAF